MTIKELKLIVCGVKGQVKIIKGKIKDAPCIDCGKILIVSDFAFKLDGKEANENINDFSPICGECFSLRDKMLVGS